MSQLDSPVSSYRDERQYPSEAPAGANEPYAGILGAGHGDSETESDETLGLLSGVAVHVKPPSDRITTSTGSSWYASVFLVVNAALGAGLLNFPAAFDKSGGIATAIIIQAVLMTFVISSLVVLAYCSDLNQCATYQDVVYSLCGKRMQTIVAAIIMLYTFGTCITFFVIIADQWDKFLTFAYGSDYCNYWYMNRKFTMTTTSVLLILPICFPRRIDFLKYPSFVGVIGILYCVILVTVKYFVGNVVPGPIKTHPTVWTDVFIVVPVICFGYQCHVSVVPIYSCLQHRTLREFIKTLLVAIAICAFTYTGTASFGYLTFGSHVNEDILLSYEPTTDVLIAVILMAAKMYTTYPILLFVGRSAFESLWIELRRLPAEVIVNQERRRRIIVTVVWFCTSLLMAVIVPNIGMVISVLGGLAALFIFIFPGLCLLQLLLRGYVNPVAHKHRYRLLWGMAVFYLVIGGFLFGVVTTQAIWDDVTEGSQGHGVHQSVCE